MSAMERSFSTTRRVGGEVLQRDQIVLCHVTPPPYLFPPPGAVLLPERTLAVSPCQRDGMA